MKLHFYLATKNAHKLKEAGRIMAAEGIEVLPCPDNVVFPEESGSTFLENALIKAECLSKYLPGEPVAGEDSGLVVPILKGLPGIYSARFAGREKDDAENIKKLLHELSGYRDESERMAKFITEIAFINKDGKHFFRGEIEGIIAFEPRGSKGFGYDPVFLIPDKEKTFAELSSEEKNLISHRADAFRKLALYLQKGMKKGYNI